MIKLSAVLVSLSIVMNLAGCDISRINKNESQINIVQSEKEAESTDGKKKNDSDLLPDENPPKPTQNETSYSKQIKVHYIDVGQGDCEFIELPYGQTMLIDAGNQENGEQIVNYIKALGYSRLDFVVATHPHAAHIGVMAEVLNSFSIGKKYMPNK